MQIHPIIDFWFGVIAKDGSVDPEIKKRWWAKSADFDALCRSEFEGELSAAKAGEREFLKESPRGTLALILLCDQIPRNIYRDSAEAFASDPLALAATLQLIESKTDQELLPIERSFAYMPLMHAEDKEIHKISIERFTALKDEGTDFLGFAEMHKAIVDRFGRYPHRNAILGRASSPEEIEFLQQPGSSF